jgi:hypothetical protein
MGEGRVSPFRRFWRALPIDGRGFLPPADRNARRLHAWAARSVWRRFPWPVRPFAILAGRILWCVRAIPLVRDFARRNGIARSRSLRLYADACLAGLPPAEAYYWRYLLNVRERPLSSRAFARILSQLGAPDQRSLLSDKVATAEALAPAAIRFPKQIALIPRHAAVTTLPPGESAFFAKPRSGAASRLTLAMDRLEGGAWRINGTDRDPAFVAALLQLALRRDDLIVQERLTATHELAGIAAIRPPVLRIHTLRGPERGQEPGIHSAILSTSMPRRSPANGRPNALMIPVAAGTGTMQRGFCFPEPLTGEPAWIGKTLPCYTEACRMALAGAALLDGLPMIAWEFILTPDGPVMLEGNSEPGHHFAGLAASAQPDTAPIFPLLARWLPEA